MRKTIIAISLVLAAGAACAQCYGSDTNKQCFDAQSGNSYSVNKLGNSTYMSGSNPNTGSTWQQNSHRIGNTTNTYGTASDGSSWNQSVTTNGSSRTISGTDSRGNPYFKTCNQYGCF